MIERVETYDSSQTDDTTPPERYKSHCQGRCGIPYLEDLRMPD